MIISIIIDKLINEPKFVLFIKNNITKFIILISKAIVIKFFILFNFQYRFVQVRLCHNSGVSFSFL